jgi:hypothetical protein
METPFAVLARRELGVVPGVRPPAEVSGLRKLVSLWVVLLAEPGDIDTTGTACVDHEYRGASCNLLVGVRKKRLGSPSDLDGDLAGSVVTRNSDDHTTQLPDNGLRTAVSHPSPLLSQPHGISAVTYGIQSARIPPIGRLDEKSAKTPISPSVDIPIRRRF